MMGWALLGRPILLGGARSRAWGWVRSPGRACASRSVVEVLLLRAQSQWPAEGASGHLFHQVNHSSFLGSGPLDIVEN